MALPNDPIMLLSMINLKLRDFYPTLDALCEDLDEDKAALCARLSAVGAEHCTVGQGDLPDLQRGVERFHDTP